MHAPIQHEQAYTPPEDTDTIAEPETEPDSEPELESESEAMDVGEQTTNQPQPATTGAR